MYRLSLHNVFKWIISEIFSVLYENRYIYSAKRWIQEHNLSIHHDTKWILGVLPVFLQLTEKWDIMANHLSIPLLCNLPIFHERPVQFIITFFGTNRKSAHTIVNFCNEWQCEGFFAQDLSLIIPFTPVRELDVLFTWYSFGVLEKVDLTTTAPPAGW